MKLVRPYLVTDSVLTASNVPESDHPAYSPSATYAAGESVIVIAANIHKIYKSEQNANSGKNPATETLWWTEQGATNKWKMFDPLVNSQTTFDGNITFTLTTTGRVNSIALLNCYASAVHIVATTGADGTVFDRTVDLRSSLGIIDWWSWFFEPPEYDADVVITDLPTYTDMTITVTMTGINSLSKCGSCIVGLSKTLGETQYGASVGIQDYSIKTRDVWGNYSIQERAYNKRASFTLNVDNGTIDRLQAILTDHRATPILYIGAEVYGSTAILGFYKDFSISIAYFSYSVCTIEIEGLI